MTDRERQDPLPSDGPPPPPGPAETTPDAAPATPAGPGTVPPPPPPAAGTYWEPPQMPASEYQTGSAAPPPDLQHSTAAPETAAAAARTSPVVTERRRGGGAKWGIALVVLALAIGATAAAVFVLTGSTSPSVLMGYAPATSAAYGELRLDLPGDQRAKVADFLAHFPGFDDRSTLETKIIETLDLRLEEATDGEINYSTDIQPWFGGQLGFSVNQAPDPDDPSSLRGSLYLSVTDGARAMAWVEEVGGGAFEQTSYGGTAMLIQEQDEVEIGIAVADDRVLVIGDRLSVEQAIDSRGESGLASDADFAAALAAVPGEGIGFLFLDNLAYFGMASEVAAEELPCDLGGAAFQRFVPAWTAFGLRVESDGIRLDSAVPPIEALPLPENDAGTVAEYAPPSTILLVEGSDVGRALTTVIDTFRGCPEVAEGLTEVEGMLQGFGGVNGLVDWVDNAGFVVARSADGGFDGGLVITPTDAGAAEERLSTVYNLIVLAGAQMGLQTSEEDYNGATIRTITGNLEDLSAVGGAPDPSLAGEEMQFAYTATDSIVIFGGNATFVKSALDAAAGESLADTPRYADALAKTGTDSAGVAFADVTAARQLLEQMAEDEGEDMDSYRTEILPWIEPFDVFIQSTIAGDPMQIRSYVIVKE